jgi:hypothetical protein
MTAAATALLCSVPFGIVWIRIDEDLSLPGLTRQSIISRNEMDARVKPAHDSGETGRIQ